MSEHNGQAVDELTISVITPARGRRAPGHPATVLPDSGYEVQVRRLAAGTPVQLRAVAYRELLAERPAPPTQTIEVGPGETRTVERTSDPDYQRALEAWSRKVQLLAGEKLVQLVQDYAVLTPTDDNQVAAFRAAMIAVGRDTSELTDRQVWVWEILAPTDGDQTALMAFVLGLSEAAQEAVQAHKRTFRGGVPGAPAGAMGDPAREG